MRPRMDILIYFYIFKYILIYLMMLKVVFEYLFDYHLDGDEFQPKRGYLEGGDGHKLGDTFLEDRQ